MPRHSSYRNNHGIDPVGGDWSTGQLVIGIAIVFVIAIVCFASGYVVARNDSPIGDRAAVSPGASTPPQATDATEAGNDAPVDKSPVASNSPTEASNTPPATPETSPDKPSDTIQRPGFRPTTIEPLPDPGRAPLVRTNVDLTKAPAAEVQAAGPGTGTPPPDTTPPKVVLEPMDVAINTQPAPQRVVPPAPAPVTETTPPQADPDTTAAAPSKPVAPPPVVAPPAVSPPKQSNTKKPPPVPTVTKGTFGIQVAAFEGPQRSDQAKEFLRTMKANAQQDGDIIVTGDGSYHKVVVTGFATRDAAKAACEKLKSKPGLAGAWVVRLP